MPRYTLSLVALWLICSVYLITIYVAQEFLEGLFATGHPAGLAGIFGYGGWGRFRPPVRGAGARRGVPRRPVGA